MPANICGGRKVDLVCMLSVCLALNDNVRSDEFCEVVHGKPGINLLDNIFRLFGVETEQTNGMLQVSERSLYSPAQMVEIFQLIRRKRRLI